MYKALEPKPDNAALYLERAGDVGERTSLVEEKNDASAGGYAVRSGGAANQVLQGVSLFGGKAELKRGLAHRLSWEGVVHPFLANLLLFRNPHPNSSLGHELTRRGTQQECSTHRRPLSTTTAKESRKPAAILADKASCCQGVDSPRSVAWLPYPFLGKKVLFL